MTGFILILNGGSSSIRCALHAIGETSRPAVSARVERIGLPEARMRTIDGDAAPHVQAIRAADHAEAIAAVLDWLESRGYLRQIVAAGHRVVHGGGRFSRAVRITGEVLSTLKALQPLAPEHLPGEIAIIEALARRCPALPQAACFDTAFHHDLPRVAQQLPVPRGYELQGVRRYGFHGLSYAYLLRELRQIAGDEAAQGRVIFAHLGNGSSMAAVRDGKCIDTTMAFTPAAGLMMGTRSGDIDPGLMLHFLRNEELSADQLDELVNARSGLLGVSETSSDMRDLLARQADDVRAAEAVALYCYTARKWLGALAAAMGGIDTLVFSGGIGENAPEVRRRICEGLEFLGIALDGERNAANAPIISVADGRRTVRVIPTDEESMIRLEVCELFGIKG